MLDAEASGVKSCADSPRWLVPSTDIRIGKDRTGPDLDERSLFVSMSPKFSMLPNQAISFGQIHPFLPARRHTTVDHSHPAGGAQRQGSRRAGRMAVSARVPVLSLSPKKIQCMVGRIESSVYDEAGVDF